MDDERAKNERLTCEDWTMNAHKTYDKCTGKESSMTLDGFIREV